MPNAPLDLPVISALGVVASKMGSIVNVVKEHPEMMQGYGRARKAVRKLVADLD